jgi:hypothetical protein
MTSDVLRTFLHHQKGYTHKSCGTFDRRWLAIIMLLIVLQGLRVVPTRTDKSHVAS